MQKNVNGHGIMAPTSNGRMYVAMFDFSGFSPLSAAVSDQQRHSGARPTFALDRMVENQGCHALNHS